MVRARDIPFALLTPRDGGASWVLRAGRGLEETLTAAMPGCGGGEVRFAYPPSAWGDGLFAVWIVISIVLFGGPALWSALSEVGPSYFMLCILPAYPVHSLISLGALAGALLQGKTTFAYLCIRGSECSFLLPQGAKGLSRVKLSPAAVRGRTEVADPTGVSVRRFSLPPSLLTQELQLHIIEQLLPPDEPRPEEAP
jgi:hypothetical protein